MTELTGLASASGHITLVFSVQDGAINPINQGSRGIGLCIDPDVPACNVKVKATKGSGNVLSNLDNGDNHLQKTVIELLSDLVPELLQYDWQINQQCGLPQQQGFGLSAAGSLATAMALQRALSIEEKLAYSNSYHIAHLVERKLSGGLGDIAALWAGGVDLRREPGCPFLGENIGGNGVVDGWYTNLKMIVAWRDRTTRHTSSYIDNEEWKNRIRISGEEQLEALQSGQWNNSRWAEILSASTAFAVDSKLALDAGRNELLLMGEQVIETTQSDASPHLCMLGESVVILPQSIDKEFQDAEIAEMITHLNSMGLKSTLVTLSEKSLR
ncbi:MAG: hypothetical protein HOE69_04915 [Euryarchaeota archaeon]|jgi:pantoate kinase|nr:hypothetical protein [Euryarchaeota archaeon]